MTITDLMTKATVLGVPTLYIVGTAYLQTFWGGFGLNDDLFAYTTSEVLRAGALAGTGTFGIAISSKAFLIIVAFLTLPSLIIILLMQFGVTSIAKFRIWKKRVRRRRQLQSFGIENSYKLKKRGVRGQIISSLNRAMDAWSGISMAVLAPLFIMIILLSILIQPAGMLGTQHAVEGRRQVEKIIKMRSEAILATTESDRSTRYIMLQCSAAACGLYDGEKIIVLARTAIREFQRCEKIARASQHGILCLDQIQKN
ncbi:hypothetical protein [Xanthomonas hortorum]|uniref:hypothetical protein n=1 Tax=Xanthomonas hortorum TaxID=56454 RepID=UPI0015942A3C|nr:hypothetical protein [Xanthomonas hortorum]NHF65283.1 hypothetical protein [Xanthomonas hortorum]